MSDSLALAYSILDAARASGLGRSTLYELIAAGKIEARKVGARTLIPADSLRRFITSLPAAEIHTGRQSEIDRHIANAPRHPGRTA
jgi:excisionase family DNA binding protein